ncbi:Mis12 protein-domain-containing protein [Peziza echinospora]|nr:Mis12 protein-domain-containing protein [Peziza echinospora]
MSAYNNAQVALLTEHFQHTPIALIDEVINTINLIHNSGIDKLENYLLNEPADRLGFPPPTTSTLPETDADGKILLSEAAENEIRAGVHKLETLLESAIDRNFDRFELYVLRNILTVPEDLVGWIRLAHHKGLDFQPPPPSAPPSTQSTPADETLSFHPTHPTNSTLRLLRQKLIASHHINQTLKTDRDTNAVLIARLKSILNQSTTTTTSQTTESTSSQATPDGAAAAAAEPLQFLSTPTLTPPSLLPLSTTTAFIASQISSIRALLESIEPKYLSTPALFTEDEDPNHPSSEGGNSFDNTLTDLDPENTAISPDGKRKRYIEMMARRHMIKQRRLKLTGRGEVVGGEFWEGGEGGEGRRRGLAEVTDLEGLFGGGAGTGTGAGAGGDGPGAEGGKS